MAYKVPHTSVPASAVLFLSPLAPTSPFLVIFTLILIFVFVNYETLANPSGFLLVLILLLGAVVGVDAIAHGRVALAFVLST